METNIKRIVKGYKYLKKRPQEKSNYETELADKVTKLLLTNLLNKVFKKYKRLYCKFRNPRPKPS